MFTNHVRPIFLLAVGAVLGLLGGTLFGDLADGRYRAESTARGVVRFDTRTGDLSICRLSVTQVASCSPWGQKVAKARAEP